jgi:transposase
MSQGCKRAPEAKLFLVADEIYGHIPRDHFYTRLDHLLQLEFVRELTLPLYRAGGRPSLDPVVFFKCMFIGFFENIIYDTQLEYRIADSFTLRRFLGYALDERTPDESTLRKTRRGMPEEVFDAVFQKVLDQCQQAGLIKGRVLGLDSTQVDANASMDSLQHKTLHCTYEQYILALRQQEQAEATAEEAKRADRQRTGKASNAEWESTTDHEARVMQHSDGHTHLSYRVDATVDLETGIITNVGADFANVSDQTDFLPRVDEAVEALAERGLTVVAIVADKGHHSGENLAGIAEREVIGLISSPHLDRGKPGFQRVDFEYDAEADVFRCPAGKELRPRKTPEGAARHYHARGSDCQACPHFGTCTKSRNGRSLSVSPYEELIQENRARVHSEAARPLMMIRRQHGEAPFGYFKQFGGLRRFMGRGLAYAQKKTLLAAAGYNLIKLLRRSAETAAAGGAAAPRAPKTPLGRLFGVLRGPQGGLRGVWGAGVGLGAIWRSLIERGLTPVAVGPNRARMTLKSGGC